MELISVQLWGGGNEWEFRLNIHVVSSFSCWLDRTSQKCRSGKTPNSPDSWSINWAFSENRYFSVLFRPAENYHKYPFPSPSAVLANICVCSCIEKKREKQHGNCDFLWEIKISWETEYWEALTNHLLLYFIIVNGTCACTLLLTRRDSLVRWSSKLEWGCTLAQLQCF